jgi:Domain of unknown function (DUF3883)
MDKMIFLNVGWMSEYSGRRQKIEGGGKYVKIHGYGHEMLNFKAFGGKMYGTAVTPHYGAINLRKLGAAKGAEFVDGVLVVWVAKSRIVGWYKDARVYRLSQLPPKGSGRWYKGKPIKFRATAKASGCKVLNPDNRHFPVPRARERTHAMGRYIWYAEGQANKAFRAKVIKYVASGGKISVLAKAQRPKIGGLHQPDPLKRAHVEEAAVLLATKYFEGLDYVVSSVEGDNVGWDLNAIHRQTGVHLRLEAKGFSGGEINVEMTPNEYKMMNKHKSSYRICVGTHCLKKSQRCLAVFAFNDTSHAWVDGNDRWLQIKELKSARLRLANG